MIPIHGANISHENSSMEDGPKHPSLTSSANTDSLWSNIKVVQESVGLREPEIDPFGFSALPVC